MTYKAIGIMSGSSLDGLDIAYVHLHETGGKWSYEFIHTACLPYSAEWQHALKSATKLSALDYQLLHTKFGHYIGEEVNRFIHEYNLHHKVDLVASHGHTTFHIPQQKMTGQIGDGAAIAAVTQLPVVSDLRALDIAFGGQGAPIVPIGEKLLLGQDAFFLNLGGIANISANLPGEHYVAFDICAANRVLNMLIKKLDKDFDHNGNTASTGKINTDLLNELNQLAYYQLPYPKSLANDFGTDVVYPIIKDFDLSIEDELCTYVEHIAVQIKNSIAGVQQSNYPADAQQQLLATGGGALNGFMMSRIQFHLQQIGITAAPANDTLINFKEALVMALIGVLRWREEYNVLASVTGASRNSINGALWLGVEA